VYTSDAHSFWGQQRAWSDVTEILKFVHVVLLLFIYTIGFLLKKTSWEGSQKRFTKKTLPMQESYSAGGVSISAVHKLCDRRRHSFHQRWNASL